MRPRNLTLAAMLAAVVPLVAVAASADPADPPSPTAGWAMSTPEEQGIDSCALARLVDAAGVYQQDSLLIVRHGRIVLDVSYAPYDAGIPHDVMSITKSVIGTLTAIEVQRGLLDRVDHPVVDLFSGMPIANLDADKRAMTVQSLLDMTSGIAWTEDHYAPEGSISRMDKAADRTAVVLDRPMAHPPGRQFQYYGGNSYVLSALLTRRRGRNAFDFAKDELFGPLGITDVHWGRPDAQNVVDGENGLVMTPRDMAKLGLLYLQGGLWDGRQLIPRSWVERVQAGPVSAPSGYHYGNLWWSRPERGAFMALGRHSQIILVIPNLDLVAVLTGSLPDGDDFPMTRLIEAVSNAVMSQSALPPNPAAQSVLADAVHRAAIEPAGLFADPPELARTISGRSYRFGGNALHVTSLALNLADPNPTWTITFEHGHADDDPAQIGGPIGLDGVFRTSPRESDAIDAVKGRWMNDHTFELRRRRLGRSTSEIWALAFDGTMVDVRFENTDGFRADLHGEAN